MKETQGYLKHPMSWLCPVCIYYKLKEKITGNSYDYDIFCTKDDEVKE